MPVQPPSHSSPFPTFLYLSISFTYPLLLLFSLSLFLFLLLPYCIIERGRKQPQVLSCRHPKVLIILQSRGDHPSAGSQTGECKGFLFILPHNTPFLCKQPSHPAIKGNNIWGAMHTLTHTPFLKLQLMRFIQPVTQQSFASENILYCRTECLFALPHQLLNYRNKSFCTVLVIKDPLLFLRPIQQATARLWYWGRLPVEEHECDPLLLLMNSK